MTEIVSVDRHEEFMGLAIEQAERALRVSEVPVGCVFVDKDGNVLARGHNLTNETSNGTQHAELVAMNCFLLEEKRDPRLLEGSTLYVTCEPCIMCAAAISRVKVGHVVFGCFNDRFGGNGSILSIHSDPSISGHKYSVQSGVLKDKAIEVFQNFYESENRRAPEPKRRKKESK